MIHKPLKESNVLIMGHPCTIHNKENNTMGKYNRVFCVYGIRIVIIII